MGESKRTIFFMVILSFICALILSVLASALAEPKQIARELDRSKQMMIAAHIFTHEDNPSRDELLTVYKRRLIPFLVNDKGERKSFKEANLNEAQYTADFRKTGYYKQEWKLLYEILSNEGDKPEGYVIPINGMGLWDAIYGYLAVKLDGTTVIGISWYDQKETPGLGANISEEPWQSLFPGKRLFQGTGDINFKVAPLGIVVLHGKVSEVLGTSFKANSAVDGMAGATLTGNGVTAAYRDVLEAYRPFLIKLHEASR